MNKIAYFDFCETLANFQTADAFVDFVRKKSNKSSMRFLNFSLLVLLKLRFNLFLNKFFPNAGVIKKFKLMQLKGVSSDTLNEYAKEYYLTQIKPNLISKVLDELLDLQKKDYNIIVVSAGYAVYLKYFTQEYSIKHLIATELAFSSDGKKCLGKMLGKDCIYTEKVKRIEAYFGNEDLDYSDSISYSDSPSDLPMMRLTEKAVVVSESMSQNWSKENNFQEIIWSK
ncbi:HAD-IB family hydrolase [Carboxylicivirga sp. N1Y90]|uniref:HAD-IB family hydrolase n=1 Tax=Carboxylicivirga fragile TaxID=3417571 RepID=UPI003D357821|nr:HAD-IB family hydrolase [Marinilabiliaceae bacterium N1Y90]